MGSVFSCRSNDSVLVIDSIKTIPDDNSDDDDDDIKTNEPDLQCSKSAELETGSDLTQSFSVSSDTTARSFSLTSREATQNIQRKSTNELDLKDKDGETLLHKAATQGNDTQIKELIEQGANLNILNLAGQTPLQVAISKLKASTVKLLIDFGANCSIPDRYGRVPLHSASETGDLDLVKEILKVGVKVDVQDCLYWTPLHVAASEGHEGVTRLLLEASELLTLLVKVVDQVRLQVDVTWPVPPTF